MIPLAETDDFVRLKEFDFKRNKNLYMPYREKLQNISNFFRKKGEPLWNKLDHPDEKPLLPLDPDLDILMNRYRALLAAEDFQDFTEFNFRSPIPNLLALLHISNLLFSHSYPGGSEGELGGKHLLSL